MPDLDRWPLHTHLKIITAILVCQFALGLVVAALAYGDIHSGAMGMEYGRRMQRDFDQMRQAPEYREPPEVHGTSFGRLIEYRYSGARDRGRAGMVAFMAGLGASLLAGVVLWLLGRVQRRSLAHTTA